MGTCLTIIAGNAAIFIPMFFRLRTEANADRRQIQAEMGEFRAALAELRKDFTQEVKDFHARLCVIEESKKKH